MTPATVYASGLVTGVVWLVLGFSGVTKAVTRILPRPVVIGIILGLGLSFMTEGTGCERISTASFCLPWRPVCGWLPAAMLFS